MQRRGLLGLLSTLVLALAAEGAGAAAISGTDFHACWMMSRDRTNDYGIAVANDGSVPAQVSVSSPTRTLDTATVQPGDVHVFRYSPGDRRAPEQLLGTRRGMLSYRVTSDQPVSAYQFNTLLASTISAQMTHDAATILPLGSLGSRYLVTAWTEADIGGAPSLIAVIGVTPEPTRVTVVPTAPVLAGDLPASPPGTAVTFTLQRGEVVQLASAARGSDFTGTTVVADRPVAVFGGAECAQVPDGTSFCDHLEEQFFPMQAWGRDHLAPKSKPRGTIPDFWRVLAQRDGTTVTLTPDVLGTGPVVLSSGQHLQLSSVVDVHVAATEPVQVTQYFAGATYSGLSSGPGDPSVFLVIPTEQFERRFLFWVPPDFADDNVMVVARQGSECVLDGVPIPDTSFAPMGATAHAKAIVRVADGVHALQCAEPAMAYVFGYERDTSYAYYAGGRPDPIGTTITCSVSVTVPGPCDAGRVTVDASLSAGAPPLSFTWSAFTPGLVIDDPASATSGATVPAGGGLAAVTISNDDDAVTCWLDIPAPPPPAPPPDVQCEALVTAPARWRGGGPATVLATGGGACPPVTLTNSRTGDGGDASGGYPCGLTPVEFTATDARGASASCTTIVEITEAEAPSEISATPAVERLRVARLPGERLRLTFEWPPDGNWASNAYEGTIPSDGLRGRYDHVPIECSFVPVPTGPGVQELLVPMTPDVTSYFLVSASNCAGEGTRGFRSDGVERPALPSDCGLAR